MMLAGVCVIAFTQGGDAAVTTLNNGIEKAFSLILTLCPIMCFYTGLMEIAEMTGITKIVAKLLSPVTSLLFSKKVQHSPAMEKISMNMSANILGMGNAATPLGLEAMKELDSLNPNPEVASKAMCMFIVINTASIQLIPSSVIALRSQYGSLSPSDIMLPTIITTLCAFVVGTFSAKLCERFFYE